MANQEHTPRRLTAILFNAIKAYQDGIGILSPADELLFCNQAFARNLGLTMADVSGCTMMDVMRKSVRSGRGIKADNEDIEGFIREVQQQRQHSGFVSFEADAMDGRWIKVSRLVTEDKHVFIYSADITHLKRVEQELRKALARVEVLAATDALTGVSNRRHFMAQALVELERSKRYAHPLSLLALDIDHFKSINDTYGHQGGDEVLKVFSGAIAGLLRGSDLFGRLGGGGVFCVAARHRRGSGPAACRAHS